MKPGYKFRWAKARLSSVDEEALFLFVREKAMPTTHD